MSTLGQLLGSYRTGALSEREMGAALIVRYIRSYILDSISPEVDALVRNRPAPVIAGIYIVAPGTDTPASLCHRGW